MKENEIKINDAVYVKKGLEVSIDKDGLKYCIVRCHDAGVHSGYIDEWDSEKSPRVVKLIKTRRLWRWWGKTLSGLASEGTFAPEKCKFSNEIEEIFVLDACEIIPCTEAGMESIRGVKPWTND
ncbi:MAG: hypothetical protein GY928_20745 [Colwellia sp.]|nr:hypothetical protein [Colwellia sp.]